MSWHCLRTLSLQETQSSYQEKTIQAFSHSRSSIRFQIRTYETLVFNSITNHPQDLTTTTPKPTPKLGPGPTMRKPQMPKKKRNVSLLVLRHEFRLTNPAATAAAPKSTRAKRQKTGNEPVPVVDDEDSEDGEEEAEGEEDDDEEPAAAKPAPRKQARKTDYSESPVIAGDEDESDDE